MKFFPLFLCLYLCISSCRSEGMSAIPPESIVRLQGVYERVGEEQLAENCTTGKQIRLRDTPTSELYRHTALFDHPPGTVLWLDLEGAWRVDGDSIFIIQVINRIERRKEAESCR